MLISNLLPLLPTYLFIPLLSALIVAFLSGPIGCFVSWNRMAFYGHTLAHAALIGVGLGVYLAIDVTYGVLALSILIAVLLSFLYNEQSLARDTWMSIIAHGSIAIGLVVIALLPAAQKYLMIYLFGDILAVQIFDIYLLLGVAALCVAGMFFLWTPLLKLAVHEGIAQAEGVHVLLVRTAFMILVAIMVAVSIKVIGGLMLTALLIIPAAAARRLSRTPEQMAALSAVIGGISVITGIYLAYYFDLPPSASIVVMSLGLFVTLRLIIWRTFA